jgi:uncharacterized membrane protein
MSADLDALWKDESHWSWGQYKCEEDPRLVVRGRGTTLYTVNMAHPAAVQVTLITMALLSASVIVPVLLGAPFVGVIMVLVELVALFIVCDRMVNAEP